MDEQAASFVVLQNGSGDLYAVPVEVLERYRVSEEHRAVVEELLSADGNVRGYGQDLKITGINKSTDVTLKRGAIADSGFASWMALGTVQGLTGLVVHIPPS